MKSDSVERFRREAFEIIPLHYKPAGIPNDLLFFLGPLGSSERGRNIRVLTFQNTSIQIAALHDDPIALPIEKAFPGPYLWRLEVQKPK